VDFELTATTPAGERFVRLAAEHAPILAERAAQHDREGSFPFENFDDLQESRVMAAAVPESFGGIGVESLHDLMVGMSRLGRGDASTAIAANMHIAGGAVVVRMLRRSQTSGDAATVDTLEWLLGRLGAGEITMCFPTSEVGTDLASPFSEVTPTDGGYLLNGRKVFGTISPAADLFFPSVRIADGNGGYLTGTVMVARDSPGLEVADNWDAMGMRASGSHDILFKDCFVPKDRLFGVRNNYGKVGRGFADFALNANLPLISSFLGIAETARDIAVKTITSKRKGPKKKLLAERVPLQQLVAEMEIDIAVCRSLIDRVGRLADAFLERYRDDDAPIEESDSLMKEVQCMKYVVNRKVIEVVDRSMIVCGGMAYMNKHPLSRLYRDARAGPFMQPYAPYEAFEYIGKVAVGLEPILDR